MKMCFQMVAVVIESMEKAPTWWLCCLQKVLSLRKEWVRGRMSWGIWPDGPQWINAHLWRSSSHWRTQQENCTCQEVHKGWVQSSTKPPPPILVTVLGFDFRKPEPPELLVHELWMVCSTCRGWILPLKPCQTPKYLTTEPSSGWACSPNWARMNPQKEKLWSFPTVLN